MKKLGPDRFQTAFEREFELNRRRIKHLWTGKNMGWLSRMGRWQKARALGQLHVEQAGKLRANQREAKRLRTSILQVEAVMKILCPAVNL